MQVRGVRTHLVLAAALATLATASTAHAAEMDVGGATPVVIKAREQPLDKFIRQLSGQMGVPVVVAPGVSGTVNGDFAKPAGEVLRDLEKAFQIGFYYDGAVVHAYPSSELSREILYVDPPVAQRVLDNARSLGLPDADNRIEAADMGLVLTGSTRFVEQVRELAEAARDTGGPDASPETFRVFKLRYGWADDVSLVVGGQNVRLPGVASLLRNLVDPSGAGTGPLGVEREPVGASLPGLRGQGLQSAPADPGAAELPEAARAAASALVRGDGGASNVQIVADPLNNAVVIRDRADRMPAYERLIETLDVEPLMVEIEATIIDVNTARLRQLGIEWRASGSDAAGLVDLAGAADIATAPAGAGGGIVSLVLGDRSRFIARVRALEEQGAAHIVSKPHVITLANVEALLDNTSTFFVRVEGEEEVDLFNVSVGTALRVTPHVLEGPSGTNIKLLVSIEDGSTSDREVDSIPVIDRSTINTQALVGEGQSLLIGGLIRESNEDSVSKVPLLGDIPGIGALFRNKARSTRQDERLFLITPRVALRTAVGTGGRLDAPIVSGTEGDIVRSAPIRLERVRAGLDARGIEPEFQVDPAAADPRVERAIHAPGDAARPAPIRLERVAPPRPASPAETGPDPEPVAPLPEPEPAPAPGPAPVDDPVLQVRAPGESARLAPLGDGGGDGGASGDDGWAAVPGSSAR